MAGRYRIESELGRGGMGAVYRAHDQGTGRVVALKMLEANTGQLSALFELEYETLAKLKHPRVIEVYDFGFTESGGRYYTMELLAGDDLALGPLEWLRVCQHLRDVCTSLSLLHARRLVHRDVNPRNVRLDDTGRAKLLDFGALAPFGVANELVGTPSCMAPEALRGQPLDARTDLFSLGAVAYWSLTGRLPYAVRRLADAEHAWATPPVPPSQYVSNIPGALDDLVLALLSIDPLGRPVSAAEVIDRLSAIALLDDELLAGIAESHLGSSTLAGREPEQGKAEQLAARTLRGHGGVMLLEGSSGAGRTRLLTDLSIDAQLAGLTTVRLQGQQHSEPDAVLLALLQGLRQAVPSEAQVCFAKHLPVLAPLFDGLAAQVDGRSLAVAAEAAPERAIRMQAAVTSCIVEVAARRPLLICVDDAHLLHPSSAGVLPMLAQAAQDAQLMLCVSRRSDTPSPPAVQQLQWMGSCLTLTPLDMVAVEQLVHSIFGEVPHRTRLAQWLATSGHGNPGELLTLLRDLMTRGLIRYAGGAWVLPAELGDASLPQDSPELGTARLSHLGTFAHTLVQLLAVRRGALPEPLFFHLLPQAEPRSVLDALAQLQDEKLTTRAADGYRLAQESVRKLLLTPLSEAATRELHLTLAGALCAASPDGFAAMRDAHMDGLATSEILSGISAGLHFLAAGDETLGTALLRAGAIELTIRGDGLTAAASDLETAIEIYKQRGRSRRVYGTMMTALTLAGTYADWRLSYRYGDELLDFLAETAGVKTARRLERYLGGTFALFVCLAFSALAFLLVPSRRVANTFREVLLGLMGIGSAVLGVCTVLQDRERAEAIGRLLSPLRFFPRNHPVRMVHEFQRALVDHTFGHYADARSKAATALAYVQSPAAVARLPHTARLQLEAGIYIVLGQLDSLCTNGSAVSTLAAIDRLTTSTSQQTSASTRVAFHGHRGERGAFLHSLEEMDHLAARAGSIWRNDVQVPRMLWSTYAMCEDLMSLKRAVQQLGTLADEMPSVGRMRDACQACYLSERGMPLEALARYQHVFEAMRSESSLRSVQYLGAYARILRKAGQPALARQICEESLARLGPSELEFTMLTYGVRLELPLAIAALGDLEAAVRRLDTLLLEQAQHDNPLIHGLTHGARAELALLQADRAEAGRQLDAMGDWFRNTEHPALFAQYQRLADRARSSKTGEIAVATEAHERLSREHVAPALSDVFARPELGLAQAVRDANAECGYLYVLGLGGLKLSCASTERSAPAAALAELARCMTEHSGQSFETEVADLETMTSVSELTTIAEDASGAPLDTPWHGSSAYCFLLARDLDGVNMACGALVLIEGPQPLRRLSSLLLSQIAQVLQRPPPEND